MSPSATALLALLIDALTGDPPSLYRRVPHPVVLVGRLVDAGTRRLNAGRGPDSAGRPPDVSRLGAGVALSLATLAVAWAAGWAAHMACASLDAVRIGPLALAMLAEAALASTLLAYRGLYEHVRAVAIGLEAGPERGLAAGRAAVAHIVGRDPASLDRAGVARAAMESAAENLSDGVIAPLFWYVLLGLPGLCAYKAANTLDSMIGHRGEPFEHFGKLAARLDDALNFVPARLTALLLVAAAAIHPGTSARGALRAAWRDAGRHRSLNAGWPEAALAGALGVRLAGPRRYGAHSVEDAWMGRGRADADAGDIRRALALYVGAVTTAGALLAFAAVA